MLGVKGNFPGGLENMRCSYLTQAQSPKSAGIPTLYGSNEEDRSHKAG